MSFSDLSLLLSSCSSPTYYNETLFLPRCLGCYFLFFRLRLFPPSRFGATCIQQRGMLSKRHTWRTVAIHHPSPLPWLAWVTASLSGVNLSVSSAHLHAGQPGKLLLFIFCQNAWARLAAHRAAMQTFNRIRDRGNLFGGGSVVEGIGIAPSPFFGPVFESSRAANG